MTGPNDLRILADTWQVDLASLDDARASNDELGQRLTTVTEELAACREAARPFLKGAYGRDKSADGTSLMASVGLNTVTGSPVVVSLDTLHSRGLQAIIWTGAFDRKNTPPCEFERTDSWVSEHITAVAGHPAIAAYQVTDEPNGALENCSEVVDKVRARSELIHSLDPTKPTYITLRTGTPWAPFAGLVDLYGLVAYPVSDTRGYNENKIPAVIKKAADEGIEPYIAIMQLFGTIGFYRLPTPEELARQFEQWALAPNLKGYMLYHWAHAELDARPEYQSVLASQNEVL